MFDIGGDLGKALTFTPNLLTTGARFVGDALSQRDGGSAASPYLSAEASKKARKDDLEEGYAVGRKEFYDDPEMQRLRARREDLSKGFSGNELGAQRKEASDQISGQRSQYLNSLQGNLAKAGVGGARGAAMQASADNQFLNQKASAERKMLLDDAGLKRQGIDDLQNFIFNQKYGTLGTGLGYAQMGVADRTASQAAAANSQTSDGGIFGDLMRPFFGGRK